MPKKTKEEPVAEPVSDSAEEPIYIHTERRNITGGLILLALGIIFLVGNYYPTLDFRKLWPVILIAIGLGILLKSPRN